MIDTVEAKQLTAESGRMLLKEKLAARTWGNISCRIGEKSMVITPSGLAYDGMQPDDIVSVDMETGEWAGSRKPSSEKGIHISAYRQFPDAGFVIHTHQTYASAIGMAGFDTLNLSEEEKKKLGGIALAEYGLSSTKKLAKNVAAVFKSGAHTVLMVHHGAVIVGKDRQEAFERAILLENVCRRACKEQPDTPPVFDEALAKSLINSVKKEFKHVSYTSAPPVMACASYGKAIPAQLDDMAQMIGPLLICVKPEVSAVANALRKHEAVLVPGVGAIGQALTQKDLDVLHLLVEKSCICWLHTQAMCVNAKLSPFEIWLMHKVYIMKYSKKIAS